MTEHTVEAEEIENHEEEVGEDEEEEVEPIVRIADVLEDMYCLLEKYLKEKKKKKSDRARMGGAIGKALTEGFKYYNRLDNDNDDDDDDDDDDDENPDEPQPTRSAASVSFPQILMTLLASNPSAAPPPRGPPRSTIGSSTSESHHQQ